MAKMRQLATERGLDLSRFRGGRNRDASSSEGPVTRTIYRLVGTGETAHPEAVIVKLGISDGTSTEVLDGLNENDAVITSVISNKPVNGPVANPFGGGPRRF
jgi:HlyD family secretion protein